MHAWLTRRRTGTGLLLYKYQAHFEQNHDYEVIFLSCLFLLLLDLLHILLLAFHTQRRNMLLDLRHRLDIFDFDYLARGLRQLRSLGPIISTYSIQEMALGKRGRAKKPDLTARFPASSNFFFISLMMVLFHLSLGIPPRYSLGNIIIRVLYITNLQRVHRARHEFNLNGSFNDRTYICNRNVAANSSPSRQFPL